MAARKRQHRAAAAVTGTCRPRFRFTVAPPTLVPAPTRRGHAEHGSIHRVCGCPHERAVARVACWGCKRPIFDRPADAACRAGLVAWGILLDDRHSTEIRHDIVLRNKACGDTCACADHGGDRLVCAKPAAILHPALRRVGGARSALLLNPPRPPTSRWIARSPVTPGSLVCDRDEQKSGRCVMWLTEGFRPPA
jgi:hypothetical protein